MSYGTLGVMNIERPETAGLNYKLTPSGMTPTPGSTGYVGGANWMRIGACVGVAVLALSYPQNTVVLLGCMAALLFLAL